MTDFDDDRLLIVVAKVSSLTNELDTLQSKTQIIAICHTEKCSASLTESLEGLFKLVKSVKKADKSIIEWHYRSDGVKSTLQLFGLDRTTQRNIEKKTNALKLKVQKVKNQFEETCVIFDKGVITTRDSNMKLARFSETSVDKTCRETIVIMNEYDRDRKSVEDRKTRQERKQIELQNQIETTTAKIREVRSSQQTTEAAYGTSVVGSVLGIGAAAIGAVFFPPSTLVTGTLLAGGVMAGGAAAACKSQLESFENDRDRLSRSLTDHQSELDELEGLLGNLNEQHKQYEETIAAIKLLQSQALSLRTDALQTLDQIRTVQIVLNSVQAKLTQIIEDLNQCNYIQSRRDIAQQMRYILESILGLEQHKSPSVKQGDLEKARQALFEINNNTAEVIKIAGQQSSHSRDVTKRRR